MPLLKHNNNKHADAARHDIPPTTTHTAPLAGTGSGTGAQGFSNEPYGHHTNTSPQHIAPATGFNDHHTTHHGGMNTTHPDSAALGYGANDPYASAGVGHGNHEGYGTGHGTHEGYGASAGNNIPPSHALHANEHQKSGGSGKFEKTLGTVLGSKSLKAKGIEKEREAEALKVQSAELAEAERLEEEARARRERAVAHGAHPENKNLGGAQF